MDWSGRKVFWLPLTSFFRLLLRPFHCGAWSQATFLIRELKQQRRLEKRHLKSEFAPLQTLSRLFHLVYFVKCWQMFLELNSKGLSKFRKRKESCCLVFPSSTKREFRHFHVVVGQRRQRNVQKSCCFANQTHCFFAVLVAVRVVAALPIIIWGRGGGGGGAGRWGWIDLRGTVSCDHALPISFHFTDCSSTVMWTSESHHFPLANILSFISPSRFAC